MKYFLPCKGRNVIQIASNLLTCGTELFQDYFLPFTISKWNKLEEIDDMYFHYNALCLYYVFLHFVRYQFCWSY